MAKKVTGNGEIHYTDEERLAVFTKVCEVYQASHCTIESACKSQGLHERTFRYWKEKHGELSEIYKKARQRQFDLYWEELVTPRAESALIRLLKGETKTEKKTEPMTDKGYPTGHEKVTITTTEILPHAVITMFAMKAVHPDKFDKDEGVTQINVTFDDEAETPATKALNEEQE